MHKYAATHAHTTYALAHTQTQSTGPHTQVKGHISTQANILTIPNTSSSGICSYDSPSPHKDDEVFPRLCRKIDTSTLIDLSTLSTRAEEDWDSAIFKQSLSHVHARAHAQYTTTRATKFIIMFMRITITTTILYLATLMI